MAAGSDAPDAHAGRDGAAESPEAVSYRIDELARSAGVASTTIRLYQAKGLLWPPRLVGRTGYYDDSHLARLRVIARLQDEGFSLAGIGRVLETWEQGSNLSALVGVEQQLDALLGRNREAVIDATDLMARFPAGALDPTIVQRAAALGLVDATDDGRFRIPDLRFVETGSALAELGVPLDVVLDEWEHLADVTDSIAARFVAVFEHHLLPPTWRDGLDDDHIAALAHTLQQLRLNAEQVLLAALDTSIAKIGASRFAELMPD